MNTRLRSNQVRLMSLLQDKLLIAVRCNTLIEFTYPQDNRTILCDAYIRLKNNINYQREKKTSKLFRREENMINMRSVKDFNWFNQYKCG